MATIGEQLLQPEEGWKRIDNISGSIKYNGSWGIYSGNSFYNNTLYSSNTLGDSYSFSFYGTKFRIISQYYTNRTTEQTVVIDDSITEKYTGNNTPANIVLEYEKTGLTEGIHTVTVTNTGRGGGHGFMPIDAIDIDKDGYMIPPPRNIKEVIPYPDDGWTRYENDNKYIKYSNIGWALYNNAVHSGGSDYATYDKDGYYKIKFYGTQIRIIAPIGKTVGDILVNLDGNITQTDISSTTSDTIYCALNYEQTNLAEGIHTLTVSKVDKTDNTNFLILDAIDINEDGYLIEFNDEGDVLPTPKDGYTRYDINSKNLIEGIKLSSTNWQTETNNNYYDNTNCYSNVNGAKATIYFHGTDLMLIGTYNSSLNSDNISISLDGKTITTISESKDISYKTLIYQLHDLEDIDHVLTITNNSNSILSLDAVDINSEGYLYKPVTSNYILIKQNDKYYSFNPSDYDTTTKMYKTVSLTDDTSNFSDDISILFTSVTLGGETFKPIDKFKNNTFKIISNYNIGSKYKIYGRKVKSSMIVSNANFSTANVDNIKYFSLDGKATIKIVVNPSDSGWYTYNGSNWIELGLTIPSKNYTDLTSEELTQWNNAKNTILSQGIAYSDLKNCNFSTLSNDSKTLKFAYVIYNENYGDNAIIKSLSWCYSKNGKLKMCKDSEYDIEITNDGALITSLIDTDIMKIVAFYENKVGE